MGTMSVPSSTRRPRRAETGLIAVTGIVWAAALGIGAYGLSAAGGGPADVSEMVAIPAGEYRLGLDSAEPTYAAPAQVSLLAFFIDQHEVTNAEYASQVGSNGLLGAADWPGGQVPAGEGDHSVDAVSWDQATAYCSSLGKRLPTEAEWEAAGRGPNGQLFPWQGGADRFDDLLALDASGDGQATASQFGIRQMVTGVWEWVDSPYAAVANDERVIRGGSTEQRADLAYRQASSGRSTTAVGFRCAADLADPATTSPRAPIVFRDDFSNAASGWSTFEGADSALSYDSGGTLRFSVRLPGRGALVPAPLADLTDTEVEVTARLEEVPSGSHRYGLALRAANGEAYLLLLDSGGDRWSVNRLASTGSIDELASGETFLEAGARHRLRGRAEGSTLSFEIDGDLVMSIDDASLAAGGIGVYVETIDANEIDVHFDDLIVRSGSGRPFIDRTG